jgi:hypothetical protein
LSAGAKAGIGSGAASVAVIALSVIFNFWKEHHNKSLNQSTPRNPPAGPYDGIEKLYSAAYFDYFKQLVHNKLEVVIKKVYSYITKI